VAGHLPLAQPPATLEGESDERAHVTAAADRELRLPL
jgi:hypothetical protein